MTVPVTWRAKMISPVDDVTAPKLRTEFRLDRGHGVVTSATLHVSALGVFEAFLGSEPVSDDVLSPGWSSYEWRLRYRSYDVSRLLGQDPSVLGIRLGNGWYRGRLGWTGRSAFYGDRLGAIAQLEITFADGHVQTVVTDESWSAGPSEVTADDLYDGQTTDARLADDTWLTPAATLPGWGAVEVLGHDLDTLVPYIGPPVRRQESLAPVSAHVAPSGRTILDFGQNLVGRLRVRVRGEAGSVVTVRHAEVLEDGELGTRPLRSALATDRFVLSGGEDEFEPSFTFHGFRYADVHGWPGELAPDAVEAIVVHSEMTRIGTFECSDADLNRLHENVVWSMRGNFLDVPTDCPQRDERLGWTGDLAVFAPTAAYLYDVAAFLEDWSADLVAEQNAAGGRIPFVIPDILKWGAPAEFGPPRTAAVWGDVAAWMPWALWQAYGDRDLLARQWPMMVAHVRHAAGLLSENGLWDKGFQFGDWLDPDAPADDPAAAKAHPGVVATAALHRSVSMTAKAAQALGHDATEFIELAQRIGDAFRSSYVDENGTVTSDCQTVYAMAICFDLLDPDRERAAGVRLADLVEKADLRISTGFAGTPFVLDALTRTGRADLAHAMLVQRAEPGWLYPVTMGATTVWERWDSMLPDGSINPGEMTSFNHYALGAVADWMHRVIGGIAPLAPGYSSVLVAPVPSPTITSAGASLHTPHGLFAVEWTCEDGPLSLRVTVPDGVTALVRLPGEPDRTVTAGTHHLWCSYRT
ncbi:family 78 glycoside hydrolase catalytic domain [Lentzea sp. NPDC058450]|uniref:family 78 glycoside hydrolase catalytic domain n=1 Tax=Lentzea sp. NPDC058450 TaxID=3346505 RepID=UPI0036627D99